MCLIASSMTTSCKGKKNSGMRVGGAVSRAVKITQSPPSYLGPIPQARTRQRQASPAFSSESRKMRTRRSASMNHLNETTKMRVEQM